MSKITVYEDGVLKCSFDTATAQPPAPQPQPTPQPVPQPPSGGADINWIPMLTTGLVPWPPASVSGNGAAVAFLADNVTYPYGVIINIYDESGEPVVKEMCISESAHSFSPVAGQPWARAVGPTSLFAVWFGPNPSPSQDVVVLPQAGGTYYLNIRANDQSSLIHFQVGANPRTPQGGGSR